ncbi:MAG: Tim44/TimA family putative adaptor protein [Parvibaculaceae bacterium]
MGEASSLINLILLAIAVGIFFKLRSVLGQRTGKERPPLDPYAPKDTSQNDDKVVQLPRPRGQKPADDAADDDSGIGAYPQTPPYVVKDPWGGMAKEGTPLAGVLTEIALADRHFDAAAFVSGAKAAYEMIVTAFAKGDRATLKPLLAPHVYDSFAGVITEREAAGETIDQTFIGISKAELQGGSLQGSRARLSIRFVSELTACTKDREDKVIEGDPITIRKVTDLWSFERDVKASDPNWRLVATGSED